MPKCGKKVALATKILFGGLYMTAEPSTIVVVGGIRKPRGRPRVKKASSIFGKVFELQSASES